MNTDRIQLLRLQAIKILSYLINFKPGPRPHQRQVYLIVKTLGLYSFRYQGTKSWNELDTYMYFKVQAPVESCHLVAFLFQHLNVQDKVLCTTGRCAVTNVFSRGLEHHVHIPDVNGVFYNAIYVYTCHLHCIFQHRHFIMFFQL